MKIYNRKTKEIYEEKASSKALDFLYNNLFGRLLLKTIFSRRLYSKLVSLIIKSPISKFKIRSFIKKHNIDMSLYEEEKYRSFNDFFIRQKKEKYKKITKDKKLFISPADSKLISYKIDDDLVLKIKNSEYSVQELIQDENLAKTYAGGLCLVFRLTADDFHRYCHVDDGRVVASKKIMGVLHTVNSYSDKYKVFSKNQREYQRIKTENFGEIIYMEVGALQVGKIHNYELDKVTKGEEKGYFSFGGSTIVILLKKNKINLASDIVKKSKKLIEVKIEYGEVIAKKKLNILGGRDDKK